MKRTSTHPPAPKTPAAVELRSATTELHHWRVVVNLRNAMRNSDSASKRAAAIAKPKR